MTTNLSKSLFQTDEKIMSMQSQQETKSFGPEFQAFLNQSRMSTYYQDNPWPALQFPTQFGLTPPGGPINPTLSPGYRPGNTLKQPEATEGPVMNAQVPYENLANPIQVQNKGGLIIPSFMINFP